MSILFLTFYSTASENDNGYYSQTIKLNESEVSLSKDKNNVLAIIDKNTKMHYK